MSLQDSLSSIDAERNAIDRAALERPLRIGLANPKIVR